MDTNGYFLMECLVAMNHQFTFSIYPEYILQVKSL